LQNTVSGGSRHEKNGMVVTVVTKNEKAGITGHFGVTTGVTTMSPPGDRSPMTNPGKNGDRSG